MIATLPNTLTFEQAELIKTVLYFDIFKYPLTEKELFENCTLSVSKEQFENDLGFLISNDFLFRKENFIMTVQRTDSDITTRLKGNSGALNIMPVALRYSKKIASYPFVEGVCLSGSLSKNYFDENSDIDFFIITKPGRLWLCRTLLILKYKSLPKRRKKYWCTNYFISSDDLELPDRNAFTATELAFLKPTVNHAAYKKLLDYNSWYKVRYPNKPMEPDLKTLNLPGNIFKKMIETGLSGFVGKLLDNLLLDITHRHWRKKYPDLSEADFDLQFRSKKNVCKRHTKGFQNKVLKRWQERQQQFEEHFKISLR
jgi:hypothetical protein